MGTGFKKCFAIPGTSEFLKLVGENSEGIIFVDFPFADQLLNKDGEKLYQEFVEKFGPMQGWDYSFPAVFESFRALSSAIESGKPIKEYLYQEKFKGIFGDYSFDKNKTVILSDLNPK